VLPVSWSTVRLFTHILAASVWVGGQLVLAGLVPGLRGVDPELPRAVARRFAVIAWPAFGVLVVTGIWNLLEAPITWDGRYGATLMAKITVVAASGLSAFAHGRARSRHALAVFGALAGLTALGALFLGVLLHG
jgi:putative copper export protein